MQLLANVSPSSTGRAREFCDRLRPASVFLWLALTLGIVVLLLNPPFQAPDESDHFYRAFQISEGGFIGRKSSGVAGGSLPVYAVLVANPEGLPFHYEAKMTRAIWEKKWTPRTLDWRSADRTFCGFPHTVIYPPTSYLPPAIAIFLGRHAHLGPLALMYLARLAGFAASVTLGWFALQYLPVFRWAALVVLLCPMSLYLFGSVASDGVVITGAFLLVALIARAAANGGEPVTVRELIAILALAGLLAVAKVVYWPLALLALLLVWPRLRGPKRKTFFVIAWLAVCVLPVWGWGRVMASLYVPGRTDIPIDPAAQWRFVTDGPIAFLALVGRSIWEGGGGFYDWFVGVLGWGDTPLPAWFYSFFGGGVLACLVLESADANAIRWRQRWLLLTAAIVATVLIFGAQYATWNSPGSREPIDGIEGRYFLPLAPLVILSFPRLGRFRVPDFWPAIIGTTIATVGAIVCVTAVMERFYLP